jgi:hypothetical protein
VPARTYAAHTDYYGLLCRLEREKRCLGFISAEAQESSREHMGRAHDSVGPRQPPESVHPRAEHRAPLARDTAERTESAMI